LHHSAQKPPEKTGSQIIEATSETEVQGCQERSMLPHARLHYRLACCFTTCTHSPLQVIFTNLDATEHAPSQHFDESLCLTNLNVLYENGARKTHKDTDNFLSRWR
jgi:hypothetical protein